MNINIKGLCKFCNRLWYLFIIQSEVQAEWIGESMSRDEEIIVLIFMIILPFFVGLLIVCVTFLKIILSKFIPGNQ